MFTRFDAPLRADGFTLSIKKQDTNVLITFKGQLQVAEHSIGPFIDVHGATSPLLAPLAPNVAQYWRSVITGKGGFDAGYNFTAGVDSGGSLQTWGDNRFGQLGNGTSQSTNQPTPVVPETNWAQVSCGLEYTMAIKADGTLWGWGANGIGQLGNGTQDGTTLPIQVGADEDWAAIACGWFFTQAMKSDFTLWAFGDNRYGQLGIGSLNHPTRPVQVIGSWLWVACGPVHSAAIGTDGRLWSWGDNRYGQLGNGTTEATNVPVPVTSTNVWNQIACGGFYDPFGITDYKGFTLGLREDGTLWAWGYNELGLLGIPNTENTTVPVQIASDQNWKQVSCGGYHIVALKTDGTLWAWGANSDGQLGIGSFQGTNQPVRLDANTDWQQVACGSAHTIGLKEDGTLWAWGNNRDGQLGIGTSLVKTNRPTQIGTATDWIR